MGKKKTVILKKSQLSEKGSDVGLPRASLHIVSELAKQNQAIVSKMREFYAPQFHEAILRITKIQKSFEPFVSQMKNLQQIAKEWHETFDAVALPRLHEVVIPRSPDKITEEEIDEIAQRTAEIITREWKKGNRVFTLYLTKNGSLSCNPQSKNRYDMQRGKLQLNVFRFLLDVNPGTFQTTNIIREMCKAKTTRSLYTAIDTLNRRAKGALRIKSQPDIIEGKQYDGYRINPHYHIEVIE